MFEEIPTIDWDGERDLVVMPPWIMESAGTFPSMDDVFRRAEQEGSHPRVLVKLFGWFFMFLSNRHTNSLRKQ